MSYQRTSEHVTVTKKDEHSFTMSSGWSSGHPDIVPYVEVGDELEFVTINFSKIVGCYSHREGRWLLNMSDEDIDNESKERKKAWFDEKQRLLDENRKVWAATEASLPQWLRSRIEYFREHGKNFDREGWGYELALAVAADIMVSENLDLDNDDLWDSRDEFSELSGNQFGFAKALARAKREDPSFDAAGTVAALSPLGSGPYYDKD